MTHSAEADRSEISVVAYQKWEEAGHPEGQDLHFWLEAEAQLRAPGLAVRTIVTAPVPPVASADNTPKAGNVQPRPMQPNSSKPDQKRRRP